MAASRESVLPIARPPQDDAPDSIVRSAEQVVGRLIRTSTDRGVVAVLDRRIVEKGYGKTLLQALPPMPLTSDFRDVQWVFAAGSTGNGR